MPVDPMTMDAHRVANNLCNANKSCADAQKIFAYLVGMKKKPSKIGLQIRQARERKHLSQDAVGKMLGISRQGYAHYELGGALPPASELSKLCEVLDLDVGIFGRTRAEIPQIAGPDALMNELLRVWPQLDTAGKRYLLDKAQHLADADTEHPDPFEKTVLPAVHRKKPVR